MLQEEKVILVDQNDNEIGVMEKMEAHRKGLLHRAFSVFVFNSDGEMLIQKRADSKYHSPNLWTNTCCSHPRKDESLDSAAGRRLMEEMGMCCVLEHVHHFIYKTELDQGMIEHELDHVFFGVSDKTPILNSDEVSEYRYVSVPNLLNEVENNPESFTIWFRLLIPIIIELMDLNINNKV